MAGYRAEAQAGRRTGDASEKGAYSALAAVRRCELRAIVF
jgi:hypothetical protein